MIFFVDIELLIAHAGLLQSFGACASEHLATMDVNLQHRRDDHAVQQAMLAVRTILCAADLLLFAVNMVHTQQSPQNQIETVQRCAQTMLALVFGLTSKQQAMPTAGNALVGDLRQFFAQQQGAHLAATVAKQLQHSVQSLSASVHSLYNT